MPDDMCTVHEVSSPVTPPNGMAELYRQRTADRQEMAID